MKKNKIINIGFIMYLCMFSFERLVLAADGTKCNQMGKLRTDLQSFFNLLKILVPLLVIGLSIYDFIKAIGGKNDKDLKKASKRFFTRLVLAVVFFFLPVLINVLLDLFMVDSVTCIE